MSLLSLKLAMTQDSLGTVQYWSYASTNDVHTLSCTIHTWSCCCRTKMPWFSRQLKHMQVLPSTTPLFFPRVSSSSTPTHFPGANIVEPTYLGIIITKGVTTVETLHKETPEMRMSYTMRGPMQLHIIQNIHEYPVLRAIQQHQHHTGLYHLSR